MEDFYNYIVDRTLAYAALRVSPHLLKAAQSPVPPKWESLGFIDGKPYLVGPSFPNSPTHIVSHLRTEFGIDPLEAQKMAWALAEAPKGGRWSYTAPSPFGDITFHRQGDQLIPVLVPEDPSSLPTDPAYLPLVTRDIHRLITGVEQPSPFAGVRTQAPWAVGSSGQPGTSAPWMMPGPFMPFGPGGQPGFAFGMAGPVNIGMPGMFGMPWMFGMPGMFGMPWMLGMPGMWM